MKIPILSLVFLSALATLQAQVVPPVGLQDQPSLEPVQDMTFPDDSMPISSREKIAAAKRYLADFSHYLVTPIPAKRYERLRASVSEVRDLETQFGPYIFALKNPKAGVLTDQQIEQIETLVEERQGSEVNWHDSRNTIRMQGLITLWAYATEWDDETAATLKKEWEQWNDLRLAYMFDEFISKEHFQRRAWAVFTSEQKQKLIAGDYDSHIRKNTGHTKAFSANKQVLRALGEPDHPAAFDVVIARREAAWQDVVTAHRTTAKFSRQRELSMDETDEAFAIEFWKEQEAAFRLFTQAERDGIRELIQTGYENSPELVEKAAAFREGLRQQMLEKYSEHAADLLRMLGELREESQEPE